MFQDMSSGSDVAFVPASADEATVSLQLALKCADVGHLALGWPSHMRWVQCLEHEFFAQGDREKNRGMEQVSFLMDSDKPGVSETQVGFFNFVALPMFRTFVHAFPGASPMSSAVELNYKRWTDIEAVAQQPL